MASFNKVILAGNLTRDPQLSYLPNQTPAVEIGLAINRRWRGQDGEQREDTCFVDCRAYGRQAEVLNQYMSKGRGLLVEGRLNFSQWESQDGQKRSKLRVIIENFQFLGSGGGQGRAGGGGGQQQQPAPQPQAGPAPQRQAGQEPQPEPAYGGDQGEPMPPEVDAQGGDNIPF